MKNLTTIYLLASLLMFIGLAFKNNSLAKYTKQYHCTVEGEDEPTTSEYYVRRGAKCEIFADAFERQTR